MLLSSPSNATINCACCRMKRKALQQAYDLAIKLKMVGIVLTSCCVLCDVPSAAHHA